MRPQMGCFRLPVSGGLLLADVVFGGDTSIPSLTGSTRETSTATAAGANPAQACFMRSKGAEWQSCSNLALAFGVA